MWRPLRRSWCAGMGAALSLAGEFTAEAFRLAWLVQYPVWAVGVVCLLLARRTARRNGPGDAAPVRSVAAAGSRSR